MQERINFKSMPNIDTKRLSNVEPFLRQVERFTERYGIKLEFNENARWRPGSYERLKGQIVRSLFPHWEKPKGANTIKRLTRYDRYGLSSCVEDMHKIDAQLKEFRAQKASLDEEYTKKQGQLALSEITPLLLKEYDDMEINILPLPYYTTNHKRSDEAARRTRQYNAGRIPVFEPTWDMPIHPIFEDINNIKFNENRLWINRIGEITTPEALRVYGTNIDPKRWWINISIALKDINIEYSTFKKNRYETLVTLPFGDMIVNFSMTIYDMIVNYKRIQSFPANRDAHELFRNLNLRRIANHGIVFPHVNGLKHPFVHRDGNLRYNSYNRGNICFGDLDDDIMIALLTANFSHLKTLLNIWAKTYRLGNTTPLNQPQTHHIGMPLDWDDNLKALLATSKSTCRRVIDEGFDDYELFVNKYCTNCQLVQDCGVYDEISYIEKNLPEGITEEIAQQIIDPVFALNESEMDDIQTAVECIIYQMWNCVNRGTMESKLKYVLNLQGRITNGNIVSLTSFVSVFCDLIDRIRGGIYDSDNWDDVVELAILLFKIAKRIHFTDLIMLHNEGRWMDYASSKPIKKTHDESNRDYAFRMTNKANMNELVHIAGITLIEAGSTEGINPIGFAKLIINKNCYCN